MKDFFLKLTWVDYVTFLAVLRGCYVGYRSGFFPEILRIFSYLVTVVVTLRFYEQLTQFLTLKTFLNYQTARGIAFFILLAAVFGLMKLLIMMLLKLLKVGEGGFIYQFLGLVLGAGRWILLLSLLFMLIDLSPLDPLKADIRQRSMSGKEVARIAPTIFDFLASISPQLAVPKGTAG